MVYLVPNEYKCPKCGWELTYSPSDYATIWLNTNNGDPLCHSCISAFLAENVPTMEKLSGADLSSHVTDKA